MHQGITNNGKSPVSQLIYSLVAQKLVFDSCENDHNSCHFDTACGVMNMAKCMAEMNTTSQASLYLLFIGKEQTNMAAPYGAATRSK